MTYHITRNEKCTQSYLRCVLHVEVHQPRHLLLGLVPRVQPRAPHPQPVENEGQQYDRHHQRVLEVSAPALCHRGAFALCRRHSAGRRINAHVQAAGLHPVRRGSIRVVSRSAAQQRCQSLQHPPRAVCLATTALQDLHARPARSGPNCARACAVGHLGGAVGELYLEYTVLQLIWVHWQETVRNVRHES
jgi:hypothetical protein